jgi:hypothetical protein
MISTVFYRQSHHASTTMSGLTTVGTETTERVANHTHSSGEPRSLREFLNQHNLDSDRLNRQRLEALQNRSETQWSTDGVVVLGDTVVEDETRNAFYDYADDGYIWDQNFVFTQYADNTTTYPLVFRRYETNDETKIELATDLIDETRRVGVPANTYLFDGRYCDRTLVDRVESYDRRWLSVLAHDDTVEYGGSEISMNALFERIDTTERNVDGKTYSIWTKKLPVSKLGEKKVLVVEREPDHDKDDDSWDGSEYSVRYIVTNMIDAPAAHLLRTYSMSRCVETFFEDTNRN